MVLTDTDGHKQQATFTSAMIWYVDSTFFCLLTCKLALQTVFPCVVIRRERSKVPLIVRQCVEEIERRGMEEVGIYRVSGVATDIQGLKAAFDSSELSVNLISVFNCFVKPG